MKNQIQAEEKMFSQESAVEQQTSRRPKRREILHRPSGSSAQAKISATDQEGIVRFILLQDVVLISVRSKLLEVRTAEELFYVRRSLSEVEGLLSDCSFVRVSRYEIVNIRKITGFETASSHGLRIWLENGLDAWVSRRYIPRVRQKLDYPSLAFAEY